LLLGCGHESGVEDVYVMEPGVERSRGMWMVWSWRSDGTIRVFWRLCSEMRWLAPEEDENV
jgi:hypothetical protein